MTENPSPNLFASETVSSSFFLCPCHQCVLLANHLSRIKVQTKSYTYVQKHVGNYLGPEVDTETA